MTQTHSIFVPRARNGQNSALDERTDALVGEWLSLPEVAERVGVPVGKVKQMLRDRKLIGVRRDAGLMVPAAFLHGSHVLKGLHGTLTVLADSGYDDVAALRWLFTPDDTLPGTPVQALIEHRGTEVNRRAQALAL